MGFADLSIAEIAADYKLPVDEVLALCDQLGIAYKTSKSRLALEDVKEIISQILSQTERSDPKAEGGIPFVFWKLGSTGFKAHCCQYLIKELSSPIC